MSEDMNNVPENEEMDNIIVLNDEEGKLNLNSLI